MLYSRLSSVICFTHVCWRTPFGCSVEQGSWGCREPGRELRLVALLLFLQNSDQMLAPLSGLFQPTQVKSNAAHHCWTWWRFSVSMSISSIRLNFPSPGPCFTDLCPHCLRWCPLLGDLRFGEEWMSRCLTSSSGRVTCYYSGPNLFSSTYLSGLLLAAGYWQYCCDYYIWCSRHFSQRVYEIGGDVKTEGLRGWITCSKSHLHSSESFIQGLGQDPHGWRVLCTQPPASLGGWGELLSCPCLLPFQAFICAALYHLQARFTQSSYWSRKAVVKSMIFCR